MPLNDLRTFIHGASDMINGAALGYGANEYTADDLDLMPFTVPYSRWNDWGIHFRITQNYNNATAIYFNIAYGPSASPTTLTSGRTLALADAVVGRRIYLPLPHGLPNVKYVRGRMWYSGTAPTTGKCVVYFGPRDGSSNI